MLRCDCPDPPLEPPEYTPRTPVCEVCGEHCSEGFWYDFMGDIVCDDCLRDYAQRFVKWEE